MKHLSKSKIFIILALGILCVVSGIFFSIYFAAGTSNDFPYFSLIMVLLGTVCVYLALTFFKDTMLFYAGLVGWTIGIMFLLMHTNILPWTTKQLWPIIIILCGIFLFPSGYFRYKKARTTYIFPAAAMIIMGIVFSLFSFRIINMSLKEFILTWWPIILIIAGVFLIAIYFFQQRYQALFPYINENNTDLSIDDAAQDS